ncbi:hypothetical protein CCH79_00007895, partial [Gambusia affinis]
ELRSWEEELTQAALQQKCQEEALRKREQELAEREIHIVERELNIIIHQLYQEKPRVESRQGKFRRNRLKLKDGNRISLPSDFQHKITVQASPSHDHRRSLLSSGSSPPTSPLMLPRLRAIQLTPGESCTELERKGSRKKGRSRGCGVYREHSADASRTTCGFLVRHSVKPPHEGSRQRSCSAPNLRRSPRHSPAVPGVPSLLETGQQERLRRLTINRSWITQLAVASLLCFPTPLNLPVRPPPQPPCHPPRTYSVKTSLWNLDHLKDTHKDTKTTNQLFPHFWVEFSGYLKLTIFLAAVQCANDPVGLPQGPDPFTNIFTMFI